MKLRFSPRSIGTTKVRVEVGPVLAATIISGCVTLSVSYFGKLNYKLKSKKLDRGISDDIKASYIDNA